MLCEDMVGGAFEAGIIREYRFGASRPLFLECMHKGEYLATFIRRKCLDLLDHFRSCHALRVALDRSPSQRQSLLLAAVVALS